MGTVSYTHLDVYKRQALMVRFGCKIKDKKRFLQGLLCLYLSAALLSAVWRFLRRFAGTEVLKGAVL